MKTYEHMMMLEAFAMVLIILGVIGLVMTIETASVVFGVSSVAFLLFGTFLGFYPYLEI